MLLVKPIHYMYYSNLSVEELKKALSDELIPTNMIPQKYYYGIQFDGDYYPDGSFVIKKTDWNAQCFKPRIYGKIVDEKNETKIDIKIKPQFCCISFIVMWYLLIAFLLFNFFKELIIEHKANGVILFVAIIIFLITHLTKKAFKYMAENLIIPLVALLNAKAYYRQD